VLPNNSFTTRGAFGHKFSVGKVLYWPKNVPIYETTTSVLELACRVNEGIREDNIAEANEKYFNLRTCCGGYTISLEGIMILSINPFPNIEECSFFNPQISLNQVMQQLKARNLTHGTYNIQYSLGIAETYVHIRDVKYDTDIQ